MSTELLDEITRSLRVMWVSGTGRPDPDLRRELEALEERAERSGLPQLALRLQGLRACLEGPPQPSFEAQLQVWVRVRMLQRGLGLVKLRERLVAETEGRQPTPAPQPPGWTGTFVPLGALVVPPRVQLHGVDDQGRWRTLAEVAVAIDDYDRWRGRWVSRLFQDERSLGGVLEHPWQLEDHPGVDTAKRWVGRPAFDRRPTVLRRRISGLQIAPLPPGARMGVGRATVRAHRGPDGWVATSGGQPVRMEPCLAFNLSKAAAVRSGPVERDGVLLATSGQRVLLQWGEPAMFPTLDPEAETWRLEDIRVQASGAAGSILRALLAAHGLLAPHEAASTLQHSASGALSHWGAWAGARIGVENKGGLPWALGVIRGGGVGDAVDDPTMSRALWWLEHAGDVEAEREVLRQLQAARPAANEDDLWSTATMGRLALLCARDEPELSAARDRVEADGESLKRRVLAGEVLPELEPLWWHADTMAAARGADRTASVAALGLPAERLDAALVAQLGPWVASRAAPDPSTVAAWSVASSAGRLRAFVG